MDSALLPGASLAASRKQTTLSSNGHRTKGVGAVVLGGDYQGLGIVRSLGRRGVTVCVLDDEISIARYSRYLSFQHQVASLREPEQLVAALKELAQKHDVQGWVVYPTRDEQVAALAQHKEELEKIYRLPTPDWQSIQHIWDKRKTYQLAERLGIPAPRTWYPQSIEDLTQVDRFPVAVKPAIKEHFVYATRDKAWRADTPEQLRELYEKALRYIPADEIMIQDFRAGRRNIAVRLLRLFQRWRCSRQFGRLPPSSASLGVRARQHVCRND